MSKRYEVIMVKNGRYAVYDNYRKVILNGCVYDTLDQADRIAKLFESIRLKEAMI